MALNFPSTPSLNDEYTYGDRTWVYNGVAWSLKKTGLEGFQGPQGSNGPQGPQGYNGNNGAQGDTGPQGPQGFDGANGDTGPQGNQGDTGPQGPQGYNGTDGPQGPQGADSTVAGPQGPQGPAGAPSNWTLITTTYTASTGDRLLVDTSGGSFTITLPATPSTGDTVELVDAAQWGLNNLTVARNGSTIEGYSDDLLITNSGITVILIYSGTTWQVSANLGQKGSAEDAAALAIALGG